MAGVSFEATLREDGSLTIPGEAIDVLGLHPGDQVRVKVESAHGMLPDDEPDQAVLRARAARRFAEADLLVREPGKPLRDPFEAAWAAGVEEKARRMGIEL